MRSGLGSKKRRWDQREELGGEEGRKTSVGRKVNK